MRPLALLLALGLPVAAQAGIGEQIADAATALAQTRTPYAAQALGGPRGPEDSGLPTSGLDCMTFVEAALMRAAGVADGPPQHAWLRTTRYDGHEPAYCTRAHYLSDWLDRNAARGWIEDRTPALADTAGIRLHRRLWSRDWMARHGLDPDGCIAAGAAAAPLAYIASADYAPLDTRIEPGDLLAFVARTPGLDSAHVGIATRSGGIAMASSLAGHTVLKPDWRSYAVAQPQFLGVRVFRVHAFPAAQQP